MKIQNKILVGFMIEMTSFIFAGFFASIRDWILYFLFVLLGLCFAYGVRMLIEKNSIGRYKQSLRVRLR